MTQNRPKKNQTGPELRCKVCRCRFRVQSPDMTQTAMCPCPACGWIDADVVRKQRISYLGALAMVAAFYCLGLLILGMLSISVAWWCRLAGLGGTLIVLAQLGGAWWNPNRNLKANFQRAQQLTAGGVITQIANNSKKAPREPQITHGLEWQRIVFLSMAVVSVCALVSPELIRHLKGWVNNAELGVIGPGDKFLVTFPNSKQSVNGLWNAKVRPQFVFSETDRTSVRQLRGYSEKNYWGGRIQSTSSRSTFSPWAEIDLPDHEALRWRSVTLDVELEVLYPVVTYTASGRTGNEFDEITMNLNRTLELVLSSSYARRSYHSLWWWGSLSGVFLFFVAALGIAGGDADPDDSPSPEAAP